MVKNLPANADKDLIPGPVRSPREGNGNLLHLLAWNISWTREPVRPQSLGSQRVGNVPFPRFVRPENKS